MYPHEDALQKRAQYLLKRVYGDTATFRTGQWEAIRSLVLGRQRLLVVQRTGWGKSLVYFLATKLIRELNGGGTVLISPLLALMRNQIDAAQRLGIRATVINSTNYEQHQNIEEKIAGDGIDLLLISPERFANEHFREAVWAVFCKRIGLLVVDEAHCISDWGHDFRPDYRRILNILGDLAPHTPILGTTATANNRVVADVKEILGVDEVMRGGLSRESLQLFTYREPMSAANRLALLDHLMTTLEGSGIIYCTTTNDCRRVALWLQTRGHVVKPYYANVEVETGEKREQLEQELLQNEVKALVASVALGMGFDKPDLHFVIHYQYPGSIITYYQQIGRAGRGVKSAYIILMQGHEDEDIQRYFIETAFPKEEDVQKTLEVIEQSEGQATQSDLLEAVNVRQAGMLKILHHLELEGVITKQKHKYSIAAGALQPEFSRWKHVTMQRYAELAQMQAYLKHEGCLMRFISAALDDPTFTKSCGRCQNCLQRRPSYIPPVEIIEEASRFLRQGETIIFKPRKLFPRGISDSIKGKITHPNKVGVALCLYHDQGWGELVRLGKYRDNHYSHELVTASALLLSDHFLSLESPPEWVCAVPSRRHPNLVPDFSRSLAEALDLPYLEVVRSFDVRPQQKTMHNNRQQFANVAEHFEIVNHIPDTPVLLVDDMIDSGWTLTVIGYLLREHGSGDVHPFALAKVNYGDPS